MTYTKITIVIIAVLAFFSALIAIACVDHINDGKPVKRKGTFNFTVVGQRRYWRMQEMINPDDPCCDYVDIYFD